MREESSGWTGLALFAGVVMLMIGVIHVIQALVAFLRPQFYLVGSNDLLVFDFTTWGWLLLISGVILLAAGIGVMAGTLWGRVLGIMVTSINAIGQVAFLAAFPIWSIIVVALDVAVIYAIARYKEPAAEMVATERAETEKRKAA